MDYKELFTKKGRYTAYAFAMSAMEVSQSQNMSVTLRRHPNSQNYQVSWYFSSENTGEFVIGNLNAAYVVYNAHKKRMMQYGRKDV